MEAIDQAASLAHARSLLLRTEFVECENRWVTGQDPPTLSGVRSELSSVPPPGFTQHEELLLPDCCGVQGQSTVHRFEVSEQLARTVNKDLIREAHSQSSWLQRWIGGVEISNVGGYHSTERSLNRVRRDLWHGALVPEVLLPALRYLAGREADAGRHEAEEFDGDGIPKSGRLSGWLNVSGVYDYNRLHDHGADVKWSLVYFVASGTQPLPDSVTEPHFHISTAASHADKEGGALLLMTTLDRSTKAKAYMPVPPRPGELWCFPGHMSHAVMPRAARGAAAGAMQALFTGRWNLAGLTKSRNSPKPRISVACNVYTQSSSYRDACIGYDDAPPKGTRHRECSPEMEFEPLLKFEQLLCGARDKGVGGRT